jgi:hypothetical protein
MPAQPDSGTKVGWSNSRANLIAKSERFLEPGETVAHVVRCLEGPNKWIAIGVGVVIGFGIGLLIPAFGVVAFFLVYTRMYARRLVLATDRNLVVIAGGRWRWTPKQLLGRLDIETKFEPHGMWMQTDILEGRRIYVVSRTVHEARAADKDVDEA